MKSGDWRLLLGLASGVIYAQTHPRPSRRLRPNPGPAPSAYTVENLTVEGNHNYSTEQILAVAGLHAGQKAGKSEFDAARQKLEATGAFDQVSYRFAPSKDAEGYDATYVGGGGRPNLPHPFSGSAGHRRPDSRLAQAERSIVWREDSGHQSGGGSLRRVDFRIPRRAGLSPASRRQIECGRRRGSGGAVPSGQRAQVPSRT